MMEEAGLSVFSDEHFMKQALRQAELALSEEEVPIGAVVVSRNRIIGRGYNQVERLQDATAHAEMIAATAACQFLGNKFLEDCTVYVTIEPCPMCAGALAWLRPARVVYGAHEPKFGFSRFQPGMMHPKTELAHGVLEEECREMMRSFFQQKRK